MVKTLTDTLAKNRGQHIARKGKVEDQELLDTLTDMMGEIKPDNFLRNSV